MNFNVTPGKLLRLFSILAICLLQLAGAGTHATASPYYWWFPDHESKPVTANMNGYSPLLAPVSTAKAFAAGAIAARGNSQSAVTKSGLCLLCSVVDGPNSIDADPNTYARLNKGVGLLSDFGQRIGFAGTYEAGDSIIIDFEIPSTLLSLDLLNAVNVSFRRNNAYVSTPVSLGSLLNLQVLGLGVGASGKRRAAIPVPTQIDAVDITQGELLAALNGLLIYDVRAVVPIVVTPNPAITPYGTSIGLNASIRGNAPTFNWYTTPTGGTATAGPTFNTPQLTRSTTYYVDATVDGVTSFERKAVNVTLGGGPGPLWTYGDRAESTIVEGLLCVACAVTDSANAADGNPNTSSLISMGVGAAGSISQLIRFPGTYQAGDSISFDLELPNQVLSAGVLGGIFAQTYNGSTPNPTTVPLNSSLIRLEALGAGVGSTGKFRVTMAADAAFDGVRIGTGSVLAALGGLRVYEAVAHMPVTVTPPAPTIPNGTTATMTAAVRAPGATYKWYDSPTGGTPLGTSASFTTPPLSRSKTYYVEAATPDGKTSFVRTAVPVTVSGGPGPLWTYGDQQQSPIITGICALCTVNNPGAAVDADTTTASTITSTVGVLASNGQLIKFPGTYQAGDSIALFLGVPAQLINAQLLSGIRVQTYNGSTPNPDARTLDNSLIDLQLLGLDVTGSVAKFRVVVPVNSTFDGVRVDLTGTVAALSNLNVYEAAAFIPVTVTPPSATVPFGTDTSFTASIRLPGATFNWYSTPTGGTPVATDATFNTPVLVQGTTYYVEAATPDGLKSFIRTAVPITVTVGPNSPNLDCGAGATQTTGTTGICLLCVVNNPELAVDKNPQTASNIHVPVGLLGGAYQRIAFANESMPGDSLRVVIGSTTGLLNLGLLNNVTVVPRNNGAPNTADARPVNSGLISLQLLDGGARASLTYAPASVFDEVEFHVAGLATALTQIDLYYAQQITAIPGVVADTVNVCSGQTATLTANAPAGATFRWYDAATGGTLLFTGPSYTTGAITADAVYYVEATSATTLCNSEARRPVFVKVGLAAVSVTASSVTIGRGQTATFNVNTPDPALTYKWYSVPAGGTALFTGPTFTTPPLNATTTYYVEASNASGCVSAQRIQVIANVLIDNPDVPCDYANAQESATSGLLCIGCYVENQVSAVDASTGTFSTLHVIVGLLGGYTQQTLIFPSPSDAGDSARMLISFPASLADVGVLGSIEVATYNGTQFNNDRTAINSALLNLRLLPGNQQALITFAPAAIYDRIEVRMNSGVATALSALNIHYAQRFVPVPDLQPDTVTTCAGSAVTLNVAPRANTTFRWYSTATGGTPLGTGATFQSGPVTTDTAFYVEAVKTSNNCANPVRARAVVQLGTAPAAPTVDNNSVTTCSGSTAVLKATAPAGATFRWYTTATGGTAVFTGDTFTTPVLDSSVVYYAEAVSSGGCASATRTSVTVSISARPGTPTVTPSAATICSGSTATLTASSTTPGAVFNWYSDAALGTLVFTGPSFTTPALTANTTYYVVAANGQCASATPAAVVVTVNTTPVQPTVTIAPPSGVIDYGQTATLTATSVTPGATYKWYLNAAGGTPVFTGAVYTTAELAATTKFYVEATSAAGCASGRTEVTVNVNRNFNPSCDFATGQTPEIGGICLLCAVNNPTRAVDAADTTNFSTLSMPVSAAGAYVAQRLEFGSPAAAGDTVKIRINVPTGLLDLSLLSAIQIQSFSAGTANGDATLLNASTLRLQLLSAPEEAVVLFAPGAAYDAVEVRVLGGLLSALVNVNIRYANRVLASPTVTADNAIICAGGSATLTATGSASGTIRWYTMATGGSPIATGNTYAATGLTTNTTYYAEIMRTSTNCVNPVRTPVTLQVRAVPDAPQILKGDTAICAGGNAILIARPVDPTHSIRWFANASGGVPVSLDSVFTTGALTVNTTYYAEAYNGTCGNVTRVPVNITVSTAPADPVPASNNVTVCTGTPATLRATSATAGAIIRWYTVQSGGSPVATGSDFVTPPVSATTLYYVEAVSSGGGCPNGGGRILVTVNANATPAVPVVLDNAKTSCANQSVTFSVQNPVAGITYNWYSAATGGTLLGTGATYATGPLTADATFYVEAVATGNCTSTSRGTASVTVVAALNPPTVESANVTVCRGGQATLRVTNPLTGVTYHWYDAPGGNRVFTGTTFVTGIQVAAGSFYVEAVSSSGCTSTSLTRVGIQVTDAPLVPVVTGSTTVCEGATANLAIQSPQTGVTYNWYDASSGGTLLATGTTFAPAGLTTTTIYHVEAVSGTCTSASRTSVTVTVNPAPPAVTVDATSKTVCIGNTATLRVVNPVAGVTYRWYDVPTGGTALATATDFVTPALTANKDYYVSATNSNNCTVISRTKVSITVGNGPAVPVAPAEVTVCRGLRPSVQVTNPRTDLQYRWYDAPIGGNLLFIGETYTTASPLTVKDTVYVEATLPGGTCASNGRAQVILLVADAPATPVLANGGTATICSGTTATFTVQNPLSNVTYRWYDASGNLLQDAASASYTTGILTANIDVFVEAVIGGGCASPSRAKASATVGVVPTAPVISASANTICPDSTATLTATSAQAGITFNWYTNATGGSSIFTGPVFITPALRAKTTYYAEASLTGGCVSATRTPVTIDVYAQLPAPTVSVASRTANTITFQWNAIAGVLGYRVSTDGGRTFTQPSSGLTGTTHTVTGLQPNQTVTLLVMSVGASECANSAWFQGGGGTDNPAGNTIFVPNAFTPNNDGVNDILYVYGTTISSMEIRIYNQWGQLVFESRDKGRGWDGTMSGQKQPLGVYNYVLRATLQDGTTVQKRGTITVVR